MKTIRIARTISEVFRVDEETYHWLKEMQKEDPQEVFDFFYFNSVAIDKEEIKITRAKDAEARIASRL